MNSWSVHGMSCSACVLLYDVPLYWSLLGLRYPVPELTAILQPQSTLQGGFTCDSDCGGEQLYCCVSLELDCFKFIWAFTVEAWDEMWNKRSEHMAPDRSPGIRAPCMVSPLFSTFQCECLVILSRIFSVLELNCNAGVVWDATCCFHVLPWLFVFRVLL